MKKIMFNDRYGLTQAVLDGRKTQTRRIVGNRMTEDDIRAYMRGYHDVAYGLAQYKIGEEVAVAQSYNDVYEELKRKHGSSSSITRDFFHKYIQGGRAPVSNKMFVKAELMLHPIRITDIKVECLQEISDEDCLKEGVMYYDDKFGTGYMIADPYNNNYRRRCYTTPREAFAVLIDKVSGKGTWESNPCVFVYDFELVK